ncbi:hypothetical protein BACFIN_09226 [Bacteroides finegoldii DSM 17565]|nr:hypothetical protein BACFIN_09226 [Bacteroides finegoldii DSM 17565]
MIEFPYLCNNIAHTVASAMVAGNILHNVKASLMLCLVAF